MNSLIDFILSLFRSEGAAQSFLASPGQAMTNAGLINVSPQQFALAAANAVPDLALGGGDPIGAVQQAVADQFGFAPSFGPGFVSDPGFVSAPGFVDPGFGPALVAQDFIAQDAGLVASDFGAGLPNGLGGGF